MLEGIESWILDLLTDPVGFFSVILTGGLVALYGLQYRTQKAQRELMGIEQEPTVLVDGFRGGTEDRGGVESFEIRLSNLGRNPATDLKLKVAAGFHGDTPFLGGIETKPLEEAAFIQGMETQSRDEDDREWQKDYGDYLEPQERGAEFVAYDLPVRWSNTVDEAAGVLALSQLRQELAPYEKPDTLRLKIWVQFRDHEDEKQQEEVLDSVLPLCDEDGEKIWSVDLMLSKSGNPRGSHPLNMEPSSE